MIRPTRAATLSVLCRLYLNWEATTPEEEAVEDCLRRLVDHEIRDLYPRAFEEDVEFSNKPSPEIFRDSWSRN